MDGRCRVVVVDACVASLSFPFSFPFFSLSLYYNVRPFSRTTSMVPRARSISPHTTIHPRLLHTEAERGRDGERDAREGEREMRDRETARSFADQNKTRRCSFSSSASSPDADSRTLIRAVAADTAAVPTINQRTNQPTGTHGSFSRRRVLRVSLSAFFLFGTLSRSRTLFFLLLFARLYACVVRDDPSATSNCQSTILRLV